jgi:hypothetical protein
VNDFSISPRHGIDAAGAYCATEVCPAAGACCATHVSRARSDSCDGGRATDGRIPAVAGRSTQIDSGATDTIRASNIRGTCAAQPTRPLRGACICSSIDPFAARRSTVAAPSGTEYNTQDKRALAESRYIRGR